jgi:hypothetical protein
MFWVVEGKLLLLEIQPWTPPSDFAVVSLQTFSLGSSQHYQ